MPTLHDYTFSLIVSQYQFDKYLSFIIGVIILANSHILFGSYFEQLHNLQLLSAFYYLFIFNSMLLFLMFITPSCFYS